MFDSIKKAMAVGAVVAIGAFAAPAMASADKWSIDGSTEFTGAAKAAGALSMTVAGSTTTCNDINATIDLTSGATGTITTFTLDDCSTTVPNCAVTATASNLSWEVTGDATAQTVTIDDIEFTNHYVNSGGTCALNNVSLTADGSLTGDLSDNVLSFTNASGLTTPFGLPVVNGAVEIVTESGTDAVTLIS